MKVLPYLRQALGPELFLVFRRAADLIVTRRYLSSHKASSPDVREKLAESRYLIAQDNVRTNTESVQCLK